MPSVRCCKYTGEKSATSTLQSTGAKPAFALFTVDHRGNELAAITTLTTDATAAEEIAIALGATTAEDSLIVVTDSQAACRHYAAGRIASTALRILQSLPTPPDI